MERRKRHKPMRIAASPSTRSGRIIWDPVQRRAVHVDLSKEPDRHAPPIPGVKVGTDGRLESVWLPRHWSVRDPKNPGRRIRLAPSYGPNGEARFESVKQIRDAVARAQHYGEMVGWNPNR